MPIVPLAINAYKRASAFVPEVVCRNMYIERDESGLSPDQTLRIQRPGLTSQYLLAGSVEAMTNWPKEAGMFTVAGGQAYLDNVSLGSVPVGNAAVVTTTLAAGIVTNGAVYYTTGGAPALVTFPGDAPSLPVDIEQLNGYLLILTRNGRFYWMVPGENTIDPLNFATAESSGDEGRAIRRIGDEFFIFGTDSTEVWQATGDMDAPFSRAPGRLYQRGCMDRDTVRRFDNSLVWVGDDGTVYRLGSVPQAISTPGLDERIRRRSAPLSAWVFKIDGHDFYCLDIPGEGKFGYDASTQQWSEFTWPLYTGETVDGLTTAGDATGRIYRLDAGNATDNGVVFEKAISATVGFLGKGPRNDSISIGVGASDDCTIRIRWKDGQDDYPDYYDEIEARAPMDVATMYRLGEPEQPHRTFEISNVDPVILRIAGMTANDAWAGGNG